jgi:transmembrane 9 superfamily protein 2/4
LELLAALLRLHWLARALMLHLYAACLLQPTDPIAIKVNKLSSIKTQLPYDYYSLPYCRPERIVNFAENLGGL